MKIIIQEHCKSGDLEKAIIDYNKSVVDNNLKLSTKFDNESKTITENIKAGSKTIDDNLINIKNYIQKNNKDILNNMSDIKSQLNQSELRTDEKIQSLSSSLSDIEKRLLKKFVELNDYQSEKFDDNKKLYDRLFNQIINLSRESKQQIKSLSNEIIKQNDEVIKTNADLKQLNTDYLNNSHEITKKLDDYSKDTDYYFRNYQSDINARLENIKNSISGIDSLMIFIKKYIEKNQTDSNIQTEEKKPDRIEKIEDKDTKSVFEMHYKNNKLTKTERYVEGKKVFDVEYSSDGMEESSRDYDTKGQIIREIYYHPNGQVKKRIERFNRNGSIKEEITNYDKKGNKIN